MRTEEQVKQLCDRVMAIGQRLGSAPKLGPIMDTKAMQLLTVLNTMNATLLWVQQPANAEVVAPDDNARRMGAVSLFEALDYAEEYATKLY